ncbi:MAG: UDP-N-acetylglucosamine--N-acetylmuramyl-(pentapeptide) pyrophosphoryl-undecaprenol N-acetylglucosamine transferase [Patescibacteria group bacterium]|nr:UDP-N-acetylglucosamine--N-acetylmuramyl-(pentapeptide) pyrophosphoryl-undecaprenol N-acetylglucosamine transferase [Patescibacteria group bacterium]
MKKIRILLVGGGSGGHIYPLIAVAQKIEQLTKEHGNVELDLRYFGDAGGYKNILIANGVRCESIVSSKLRRYFSLQNFLDIFKFFAAIFQSLWKVFLFMPDAVFSKGGPGSLPILFVCRFFSIPVVIHESDSAPGLTNLISGKFSKKIFLAFNSAKEYFQGKDTEIVGNPVRDELTAENGSGDVIKISDSQKKEAIEKFGFAPGLPVLLVLGGSQGAVAINEFILKNIEALAAKFQILHQIGRDNFKEFKSDYDFLSQALPENIKSNYKPFAYFDENLRDAYIASDLVLARASSGTIFELACFGRPAILVPLPDAANDHQRLNAIELKKAGAAIVIEQENFLSHLVIINLEKEISSPDVLKKMSEAAYAFYKPFSADRIAAYLLSLDGIIIKN